MEEIEVFSWLTLDAIKDASEIKETIGDLQSGHFKSIFCLIEEDYLELFYSDAASNYLRHYEEKDEFALAIEKRKKELGESPYEEAPEFVEEFEEEEETDDFDTDDEDTF